MKIQTIIVEKTEGMTASQAKDKVPADLGHQSPDETETSFRFRQRDPGDFIPSTFRTKALTKGVKAVMGKLKTDGY